MDDMLVLEQPLLRLPVDELRTQLKSQQRICERDFAYCQNLLNSAAAYYAGATDQQARSLAGDERASQAVRNALARLQLLCSKLAAIEEHQGSTVQATQERAAFLEELQHAEPGSAAMDTWCAKRLDRLLIDYMLRSGARESARMLAEVAQVEPLVDLPVFTQVERIEQSLVRSPTHTPSCAAALAWCSDNKISLRKINSTLEFELRLQEFIELTRTRTRQSLLDAISYARRYLVAWVHPAKKRDAPEHPEARQLSAQAQRAFGLLACPPSSWRYHDLYDPARWDMLRAKFRRSALQVHDLPQTPLIHIVLSAGLSSLKTLSCYKHSSLPNAAKPDQPGERAHAILAETFAPYDTTLDPADDRHPDCPVCQEDGLGVLASEVPWSHHANSVLICRLTGKVMDDKNPPLCLPNGRVYSQEALEEMAQRSADGATVTCPRTGQSFPYAACRKMFIS